MQRTGSRADLQQDAEYDQQATYVAQTQLGGSTALRESRKTAGSRGALLAQSMLRYLPAR